jgi:predicted O-methyltransferase YrrM
MVSLLGDLKLQALVDRLQAQSQAQEAETNTYFAERIKAGDLSWEGFDARLTGFMADKLVALEPAKAEFCHLMCRSLRATRVVEVGTSFGVSTLYLAAAVRANGGGTVIGTEHEPAKAAAARAIFAEAGFADLIDLREGDLGETLKAIESPVDFVLMDIWTEMARPAMELVVPHLRAGGVVIADNTVQSRPGYQAFFDFVEDPANGLITMTLPFAGGLEMVVKA